MHPLPLETPSHQSCPLESGQFLKPVIQKSLSTLSRCHQRKAEPLPSCRQWKSHLDAERKTNTQLHRRTFPLKWKSHSSIKGSWRNLPTDVGLVIFLVIWTRDLTRGRVGWGFFYSLEVTGKSAQIYLMLVLIVLV